MKTIFDQLQFLSVRDGHLYMEGIDLIDLAQQYGTPLYVYSEKRLKENVNEILSSFRAFHPKTSLHYAAKCDATLANLQIINEAGSDIEVNSGGELFKALHAGFQGNQIIFNGVAKTVDEIKLAIENNIKSINVDSEFELKRIIEVAKYLKKKANVMIRFVPEVSTGVVKGNETGTHESKFGITQDKIIEVYQECLSHQNVFNIRGIHFHIGTQTYDLKSFLDAFKVMLKMTIEVYQKTGYKPEMLNIGGGLPVPHLIDITASQYMPENIYAMLRGDLSIQQIAEAVTDEMKPAKVEIWAPEFKDFFNHCELIVEAGRKVVCDAAVLLSTVENRKKREAINENWMMLDAGFNTLLEVKTYSWYYHMLSANKIDEPHIKHYKVGGPCCDSGDVYFDIDEHVNLPDYRKLPESTEVGDIIAMLNVGAYGTPTMSNYNGRPKAAIVLIQEDGTVSISRNREAYIDLLTNEYALNQLRKDKNN
ncbi:MAG: diaminopimelate decarboxylase [Clostridia bacterium]|nr:diaminopimelate decarboxylase [Clostridia bacterium]